MPLHQLGYNVVEFRLLTCDRGEVELNLRFGESTLGQNGGRCTVCLWKYPPWELSGASCMITICGILRRGH